MVRIKNDLRTLSSTSSSVNLLNIFIALLSILKQKESVTHILPDFLKKSFLVKLNFCPKVAFIYEWKNDREGGFIGN